MTVEGTTLTRMHCCSYISVSSGSGWINSFVSDEEASNGDCSWLISSLIKTIDVLGTLKANMATKKKCLKLFKCGCFCGFLNLLTVNWISLCFGLLVEQNKTFEDDLSRFWELVTVISVQLADVFKTGDSQLHYQKYLYSYSREVMWREEN